VNNKSETWKWSWPNMKHYRGISLQDPRKSKTTPSVNDPRASTSVPYLPNMQLQQAVTGPDRDVTLLVHKHGHLCGLVSGNHWTCLRRHALVSTGHGQDSQRKFQHRILSHTANRHYIRQLRSGRLHVEAGPSVTPVLAARQVNGLTRKVFL